MIRDLIKWVAPGLATVLGGTTLCLAMTSNDIVGDLTVRSTAALASEGYDWVDLSLDARDLTLRGTTTDQALLDSAVARLISLDGIRSVNPDVSLAPLARPYNLIASVGPNGINLSGGVPNGSARAHLLALAGLEQAELDLRSGAPDRQAWFAGAEFAIHQLQYFDQGRAVLSDLTVSLNGRAKSERAFGDLITALRAGAPTGVTLGDVAITPALISPYKWSASFDGNRIAVSGYVPDNGLAERYRTADVSGLPVATGLKLGSGEPSDFADLSQTLIEQLARLEYGIASISDGESRLTGAPATLEIAQSVIDTLSSSGSIVVLDAPRIEDYWMSATRQPGGVVVFDGYVPDEATRAAFSQRDGADTSYLKLGRGAPERYRSGADFGLDALALMNEGRISLRGTVLTISGTARSSADYAALMSMLAGQAPQGLTLAPAEILAPRADPYSWSVTKQTTGAMVLAGLVPSAQSEAVLLDMAGGSATETMTYASGEPNGFLASAETALSLLQWLSEGSVAFDGQGWTLTGTANSAIDKGALEADFVTRNLASAGWSMAVAESSTPVAVAPVAEPEQIKPAPVAAVDPEYAFSASHSDGSGVVMSGQLPSDQSMRFFASITSGDVSAITLAAGAPAAFLPAAEAGLRALLQLSEGQLNFAQGVWSLRGLAADAATRDAAIASLSDNTQWQTQIDLPPPPAPAPASQLAPSAPADIAACSAPVAEFSARNAILFQSGAALIAAESDAALDELALDLAACPDAVVHIEGHTDSDGDEGLNMALSVARAEAVVNALIARGVTAARLYAVGYGETAPIADNKTPEGRRLNRRIVVAVQPQHY